MTNGHELPSSTTIPLVPPLNTSFEASKPKRKLLGECEVRLKVNKCTMELGLSSQAFQFLKTRPQLDFAH